MLRFVVGQSDDVEYADALDAALSLCLGQLGDGRCSAAVLFTSVPDADHELTCRRLSSALGEDVPVVGCTTDGELSSASGYAEESVVLGLFSSDSLCFSSGFGLGLGHDPERAVNEALGHALERLGCEPRLCLVLTDGMEGGAPAVLRVVNDRLGADVTVVGGSSGSCFGESGSWLFGSGRAGQGAVSLLLVGGPLQIGVSVESGWSPMGEEQTVTSSEGNVVRRIGQASALEFYSYYLGDSIKYIQPFALSEEGVAGHVLHTPLSFDAADGSVVFSAPVPQGARVRMTEMVRDELLAAAKESIRCASARLGEPPQAALAFSCAHRGQVLGTRCHEESHLFSRCLPEDTPFMGFYTHCEIAPMDGFGPGMLHNCSFATLLLREEEAS